MKHADIALKIRSQEAERGVLENVGIELLRLTASGIARAPVMARDSITVIRVRRKIVFVITHISGHGCHHLAAIVQAVRLLGFLLAPREHREEEGGQDSDDRDDHQQLNQSEPGLASERSVAVSL